MDRRRFERLEKSGGETGRQAVLQPRSLQPANGHPDIGADLDWMAEDLLDLCLRLVGRQERIRIDVAAAVAVLRRDEPDPAGALRPGERIGSDRRAGLVVEPEGQRAVDGQFLPIGNPFRAEFLLNELAAEAGAIDEEVRFDAASIVEDQAIRCCRLCPSRSPSREHRPLRRRGSGCAGICRPRDCRNDRRRNTG